MISPTIEQERILEATSNPTRPNLFINAYAGCGKTSTIEMLAERISLDERVLALAFNKKIRDELAARLPEHFETKTFNGLGHAAWARFLGKFPKLDNYKVGGIVTELAQAHQLDLETDEWVSVVRCVGAAQTAGIIPSDFPQKGLTPDTPEVWEALAYETECDFVALAREVLIRSIKAAFGPNAIVSFDDQIYLPTLFAPSTFGRYATVIVDEAQDLSPLNHEMVRHLSAPSGRLIVCGDSRQAIYAFRGADHQSMAKLKALRPEWTELPLTVTFRCPSAIVERASLHAPGYTAAPEAPTGRIVELIEWGVGDLPSGEVAILCRNNAPLFKLTLKLLKQGIPCQMLGRDIGKGLQALAKRILGGAKRPAAECIPLVEDWKRREIQKAEQAKERYKIETISDKADCLIVVLEQVESSKELFVALSDLFNQKVSKITLASGHRAKGLEWDHVIHLDSFRVPSAFAETPAEVQQELNLKYVLETRPKQSLILANLENFS